MPPNSYAKMGIEIRKKKWKMVDEVAKVGGWH